MRTSPTDVVLLVNDSRPWPAGRRAPRRCAHPVVVAVASRLQPPWVTESRVSLDGAIDELDSAWLRARS